MKVIFHRAPPLSIVGSRSRPEANPQMSNFPKKTVSNKVCLSKAIDIPPMNQVTAAAAYESLGLVSLQNHPILVTTQIALMSNEVMNVVRNWNFAVTMSNPHDKSTRLPKETMVGITLPAPVARMEL